MFPLLIQAKFLENQISPDQPKAHIGNQKERIGWNFWTEKIKEKNWSATISSLPYFLSARKRTEKQPSDFVEDWIHGGTKSGQS